tara:strand:- start:2515 stop:2682 length:168 start_codon:yes stop_codon:yes gene_type:complete
MYLVLNEEKEIIGMTKSVKILTITENEIVEVQGCPSNVVGNAKFINGEVVYNEPS